MITQITDDMVGKNVTCKINSIVILDAKIQKYEGNYYICQNGQSGNNCPDKLGYNHSWKVNKGTSVNMSDNNLYDLELVSTELPIFN